jgi:LPS sulfotransferase NodH
MKFVIAAAPRSATTYLAASLNQHPDVFCHGEVFNPTRVEMRWFGQDRRPPTGAEAAELEALRTKDPWAFIDRVYADNDGKRVVGFKLFDMHVTAPTAGILADPSIAKIVACRPNTLARYASRQIARKTGDWKTGAAGKPKVQFVADQFKQFHEDHLRYYANLRNVLEESGQRFVWIDYEDAGSLSALEWACDFLGVSPPQERMMMKVASPGSSDIVSRFANTTDVTEYLKSNGLESMATEARVGEGATE